MNKFADKMEPPGRSNQPNLKVVGPERGKVNNSEKEQALVSSEKYKLKTLAMREAECYHAILNALADYSLTSDSSLGNGVRSNLDLLSGLKPLYYKLELILYKLKRWKNDNGINLDSAITRESIANIMQDLNKLERSPKAFSQAASNFTESIKNNETYKLFLEQKIGYLPDDIVIDLDANNQNVQNLVGENDDLGSLAA